MHAIPICGQSQVSLFTAGLRHPELFRSVASLTGSMVERDFEDRFGAVFAKPSETARYRLIWISCGSNNSLFEGNKVRAAKFVSASPKHQFLELPGFPPCQCFARS